MKFYIGYNQSYTDKFIVKATASSKTEALKINKDLSARLNKFDYNQNKHDYLRRSCFKAKLSTSLRYKMISEKQYQEIQSKKKQEAIAKRKATLAKKSPEERKKTFILCPHCRSTSKLLYTEMGGLQTRRCKRGHQFEYDKWIGDRLLSIAVFGNPVKAAEFMIKNPIMVK